MKYIRRKGDKWQTRIYMRDIRFSFTHSDLEVVKKKRNEVLGYNPDDSIIKFVNKAREVGELPNWMSKDKTPKEIGRISFGALGDTHLGSNYERLDVLHALYDIYEAREVHSVFHTGNFIDGEKHFNTQEIHIHGFDNQINYFVMQYPRRKNITTNFISGDDHEGWYNQREGVDVGLRTQQTAEYRGRDDLVYMGHVEVDAYLSFPDKPERLRVLHPGGGSAKGISLTSQNIVDAYTEADKPFILLVGHYHKAHYLPNYRGVHIIQTGACQEQSIFMRKKNLVSHIGGWIITVIGYDNGTRSVSCEYFAFPEKAKSKPIQTAFTLGSKI